MNMVRNLAIQKRGVSSSTKGKSDCGKSSCGKKDGKSCCGKCKSGCDKKDSCKKEKNPVPIKKKTVLRKSVKNNFLSPSFFPLLSFLS